LTAYVVTQLANCYRFETQDHVGFQRNSDSILRDFQRDLAWNPNAISHRNSQFDSETRFGFAQLFVRI